jgi:hypothetical protein
MNVARASSTLGMRKVIIFVKRRAAAERSSFFDWLMNRHALLVRQVAGLRRFTVSLEANGDDGVFDGMLELWFDDAEVAGYAFADESGRAVIAEGNAHASRLERVTTAEHPFLDTGEAAPFKLVAALKRRADLERAEFRSWWLDRHAPSVTLFPELRRYQVDIVDEGTECFVDGVAEVSFADLATLKRITSTAQVTDLQGDSQLHTRDRYRMFVEEHPIV